MARVVYSGEPYTVKLLLPDMGSFTYSPRNMWNLNDVVYAFMPEPNKPSYIIPVKAVSTYSTVATDVIDKSTNFNVPPINLIQLVIWKSDSSKKIYVGIVAFGVDDSGYGHNVIPKPGEADAEVVAYIGRIVGTSGSLSGGYTPVVCYDNDFSFTDCDISGIMNIVTGNNNKLHVPCNIAPLVAVLIAMAIIGGTAVGVSWSVAHMEHAKADEIKAMESVEKERLRVEQLKTVQGIISEILDKVEDDGDATRVIESVFGSSGYLQKYVDIPPSSSESENLSNSSEWWKGIGEFMKYILPFAIPVIGIIILMFKWRVILDFFRDLFRRRR